MEEYSYNNMGAIWLKINVKLLSLIKRTLVEVISKPGRLLLTLQELIGRR